MFDSKQTLTHRIADAADLLIDFATLGEYGLEPVENAGQTCNGARTRPLAITDRESFSEVLFPNRHRGDRRTTFSRTRATAATRGDQSSSAPPSLNALSNCGGSGRGLARTRGSRGASGGSTSAGAA